MIFSVIVPFLNEKSHVAQVLDAICHQDFDRNQYEVFFVDNGSTDGTAEIVEKHEDVTLLHEKRASPYIARNRGAAAARGQILAFTDADCVVWKDWLSQIYQGLTAAGAKVALGRRFAPPESTLAVRLVQEYENMKIKRVLGRSPSKYYYGYTNNMAVRAETFQKWGPFYEWKRGADTAFVLRYATQDPDAKVVFLPSMRITHLEWTRLSVLYNKYFLYGTNSARAKRSNSHKTLGLRRRIEIFRACTETRQFSLKNKAFLLTILMVGAIFYKTGELSGTLKSFPQR